MEINRGQISAVAGAMLVVGGALGYLAGYRTSPAPVPVTEVMRASKVRPQTSNANEVLALRERIRELEGKLGARSVQKENHSAPAKPANAQESERPRNPREWLDRLRQTDPQRFAQMTNRFAQFRKRQAERSRARLEFLSSIDGNKLKPSARKTHQALVELTVEREELEAKLHQEELSDEERRQCMEALRESHREFEQLNREERRNLMSEAFSSLGYEGEENQQMLSAIEEIIQSTESGFGGPRGPGGPPPPQP